MSDAAQTEREPFEALASRFYANARTLADSLIPQLKLGYPENEPRVREWAKTASVYLFAKANRTFDAVATLYERTFQQDAVILTRTLMELALQANYIAERPRAVVQFVHFTDVHAFRVFKKVDDLRRQRPDLATLDALSLARIPPQDLDRMRRAHERWADRMNRRRGPKDWNSWWRRGNEWLVRHKSNAQLLPHYVSLYTRMSHLVHSNPLAIEDYIRIEGSTLVFAYRGEPGAELSTLQLACCYFILVIAAVASTFRIEFKKEVDTAVEEHRRLLSEFASLPS
jgi:uncharacterized protein DUF5677